MKQKYKTKWKATPADYISRRQNLRTWRWNGN
jgi:hypothetical protein